jgi:site-specific DNA-methyltransferase (adenine-specific)
MTAHTGLAIPDPAEYQPAMAAELAARAIVWLEQADDLDGVIELLARLAALEEYVARRDPERLGELQRANRRGEARVGQLLGETTPGARTDLTFPHAERLRRAADRTEFRRLARWFAKWWPDGAAVSRKRLLDYCHRLERQTDDRAARIIVDAPPHDGVHLSTMHGDRWTMHPGDAADVLAAMPDQCIDLIVTDPPYPVEFADLWTMLAKQAARLLAPGGLLCAMSGKIHLPEMLTRLGDHLQYGWIYCEPMPRSSTRILARHMLQVWKPWLVYSPGKWPSGRIQWHPDMLNAVPRDKSEYRWQQATGPATQLIQSLAFDDAVVVDPFAGTGTYGVAAIQSGCRFVGIERDVDRFAAACDRIGREA